MSSRLRVLLFLMKGGLTKASFFPVLTLLGTRGLFLFQKSKYLCVALVSQGGGAPGHRPLFGYRHLLCSFLRSLRTLTASAQAYCLPALRPSSLKRCAARSVWLSLNQEPPIFFHKSPSSSIHKSIDSIHTLKPHFELWSNGCNV